MFSCTRMATVGVKGLIRCKGAELPKTLRRRHVHLFGYLDFKASDDNW